MSTARRAALAALAALALAAAAPAAEKQAAPAPAPAGQPTWHALRVTGGDTPPRIDHFWSKGRKLRSHTVVAGFPVTTLVSGDYYYVIDDLHGAGVAIRRSGKAVEQDRSRASERPFGTEGRSFVAEGAEVVRSETVAGRACKVYRQTGEQGRRELWVTDDRVQLPLRMEIVERSSGAQVRTDYLDWTRDLEIPDAFFEPDPRVQLERVEYEDYVKRSADGPVGPAPVLYGELLHGR